MPILNRLPTLQSCCGCITDMKAATAIIVVLVIVTSPIVSWAIVRHAYVVRVSCSITTDAKSPDVVDISLNNALGFGFGSNAGLVASCLTETSEEKRNENKRGDMKSLLVNSVKYSGWVVFGTDVIFLGSAVNFLFKMYKGSDERASQIFQGTGVLSVLLTFMYGILYVVACMYVRGSFPILELLFAIIDFIVWMHFLSVVYSYYKLSSHVVDNYRLPKAVLMILGFFTGINTAGLLCTPACKELYEVSSPVKLAVNILRWLLFSSEMLLLASTFGFLLGIFYSIRVTADILICTVILKCLMSFAYTVVMIVQEQYTHCRWYYSQIFHLLLFVIMWCYFIIVVSSYEEKM